MKTKGSGATRDVENRLKIYGSAGTPLCLRVRRLCAEACVGLGTSLSWQSMQKLLPVHQLRSPGTILLVDYKCVWSVPGCCFQYCPQLAALGNLFRTFCLQRQPRDAFCSPKTRRAFSSFVKCLQYACLSPMPGIFTCQKCSF